MNRFLVAVVLVALGLSSPNLTMAWETKADPPTSTAKPVSKEPLRREGERYEGVGKFVRTGERYEFYPANSKTPLRILENLSLERVARMLEHANLQREPTWAVQGVAYEFRGSNFLLLERVTVKGRARGNKSR
jgi:hypothetical protein